MLILSGVEWINLRIVATWVKILNCSNGKRLKGFFGYGNEIYFRILKGIAKCIKNLCVDSLDSNIFSCGCKRFGIFWKFIDHCLATV